MVTIHTDQGWGTLLMAVVLSLLRSIFALGEEIGWRGFLWRLMRCRLTFWRAPRSCSYLVDLPRRADLRWDGRLHRASMRSAVALLGFRVVRRRAHRAVPVGLAERAGGSGTPGPGRTFPCRCREDRVFLVTGICSVEFGWLGAAGMLILGVSFTWWHLYPGPRTAWP